MKTGLRFSALRPHDLLFSTYRDPEAPRIVLPPHPLNYGHEDLIEDWLMLANDRVGCCAISGGEHETMLFNAEAGRAIPRFNDEVTLFNYGEMTGYDPSQTDANGDNPTDQGTDMVAFMDWRMKTGLMDADGNRHKILGVAWLEPGNVDQLNEACALGMIPAIGFDLLSDSEDQFNAGEPWDINPLNFFPRDGGGHYTPNVARRNGDGLVITWRKKQAFKDRFYRRRNMQTAAILTDEFLNQGKSPEGFNLDQLRADLGALPLFMKN